MYEYMTRHMVALREINYGDSTVKAGEAFLATPDDVGYLTRAGKARESVASGRIEITRIEDPKPVFVEVDEPFVAADEPFVSGEATDVVEDAPAEEVPADDADASDEVAPVRRRGRPRKNPQ